MHFGGAVRSSVADFSTRLSPAIGTVPKDYYLQRSPYGSNDSVLTFLTEDLLPKVGRFSLSRDLRIIEELELNADRRRIFPDDRRLD